MRGIVAAAATPIGAEGGIDAAALAAHLQWLIDQGCHAVALFGTTGEAASFSVGERRQALEEVLARGIPATRIILGIGCCAHADSLALARHGRNQGIDRFLMLPPFYFKEVTEEGLYRAFASLIDDLGGTFELYLYHFPRITHVPLPLSLIERLIERYPEVVRGIKDSSGDWEHTARLLARFPDFTVFSGSDYHLLRNLRAGGAGTISAGANLAGGASRAVFDAVAQGRGEEAEQAMERVRAVRAALGRHPMIPAVKRAIAEIARCPSWAVVRPPLVPLEGREAAALIAELRAVGALPGSSSGRSGNAPE